MLVAIFRPAVSILNLMSKIKYDILTIFILTMAIIQAPLFYYYTSGFFAIFIAVPYLFVGLFLTIWLFIAVIKNRNSQITLFHKTGIIITTSIGTLSLFFCDNLIENLDWKFRRNSREEIVQLVKDDKLKPNVSHNNIICKLDNWNFPPISNGGNEIAIYKVDNNNVTIEFYIDRGFLDHYSAFIYTNDIERIKEIEGRISSETGLHINKKLESNWYRVSY